MDNSNKVKAALEQIQREFIDASIERLDQLDNMLIAMRRKDEAFSETLGDFLRHVHSLKGQGGTFDLPAITHIAHALEDYVEVSPNIGEKELDGVQIYCDRMRRVFETGENPPDDELQQLLRLSTAGMNAEEIAGQDRKAVDMLLVMPKGLQRKIIAQELDSCGFRVIIAKNPIQALDLALTHGSQMVLATMVMQPITGLELARCMRQIKKTSDVRFILMTSDDNNESDTFTLPKNTVIVRKGKDFTEDLALALMKWGVFGNLAA